MRDIAVTTVIFALLPFCLSRPWVGIVVWNWFGLMNPHRLTWGFAYSSIPFAMMIGGATLIGAMFAKDRRPIPWNRELKIVAVLLVYFAFTCFFAWVPEQAWIQFEKIFKVILMTFVATMFIYGKDRIRTLLLTVVFSLGFYAVKFMVRVPITGGAGRIDGIPGSFLDGNTFMGLAFCMVAPLMMVLARTETKPWLRRTLYIMAGLTFISIIFTYSRGAYVGLVAILPLVFLRAKSKVVAMCILVPALLIAPYVLPDRAFERVDALENYEQEGSANQRLQAWTVAWNLALDYPFTGAGMEFEYSPNEARWLSYGSEKYMWAHRSTSAAHSIYFQILGHHGFVALGLFLLLLFGTLFSLQRTKRLAEKNPETAWMGPCASGLQIGMAGYMVSGAFLNSAYFDLAYLYIAISALFRRELLPYMPVRPKWQSYGIPTPVSDATLSPQSSSWVLHKKTE